LDHPKSNYPGPVIAERTALVIEYDSELWVISHPKYQRGTEPLLTLLLR
jgi:hypothetical protein